MGYYSNYMPYYHQSKQSTDYDAYMTQLRLADKLAYEKCIGDLEGYDAEAEPFDWLYDDMYKWYDFENDMCAITAQCPDVVFEFEVKGEEYDDFWRAVFVRGQESYCAGHIIFDEPNWSDLGE